MKEIGGYFSLEELVSNEYYKDLIALNSGRNALLYLIKAKDIKKLYIPFYLCDSISDLLKLHNIKFEKYRIDSNFMPLFDNKLNKDEYIYIVNYYGQLNDNEVIKLRDKFDKIILDNAQSFFYRPIKGIDTIYTCRKFFGVPDGAYLFTEVILNEKLEVDLSKDRMTHILGRYEDVAWKYYSDFHKNEEIFVNEPIKYMSKLTRNILGAIDYTKVCKIRDENYAYLESKLYKYNKKKFQKPIGPFVYPFYVKKNGKYIREELAKRKIYVPTLWPNVLNDIYEESIEYDYAYNILPLPCDQRYSNEEMQFIVDQLIDII
ncbi:hypothetical protein CSBG_00483 [Clostridium sp. 7_2_43FAA]|uniref:hypothetical protein n=1 Tax=Clostridium TaxID=1485 RepID=UPI00019AFBBA|nr:MULTISPECIES: hypothetical protein [Clostridium]EEH96857.1 hypothetical protein CSBG_00483 [Clostridium sp. 7_2_43FAA]